MPWTPDPNIRGLLGTFDYGAPTTPPVQPYTQPYYTPSAPYQPPSPYQTNPYTAPSYQAATPFGRPEYSAADPFTSPTAATMQQDPGYQFRLTEGQKALERSGAARGVTNTGGNLKGIVDYGQQSASQEYGNVYNRSLQNYNVNEQNRLNAYGLNYGNAASAYTMNEANRARGFERNAANAFQAYGANELGRAGAYGTNEAARQSAYNVNELNAQNAYSSMNVGQAQQDYTNQFNSWVEAYNQWRASSMDRFNEQFQGRQV